MWCAGQAIYRAFADALFWHDKSIFGGVNANIVQYLSQSFPESHKGVVPLLNYYELGRTDAGQTLVVLHGLFGNARNLAGLSRHMAEVMRVIAFDLPNHGQSPHTDDMSFSAMADAVAQSTVSLGITRTHVLGHSLGGKVAMMLALKHTSLVDRLVVADVAPARYAPAHNTIFQAMLSLPSDLTTRAQADEHLATLIHEPVLRQFLLQNLDRQGDYYGWRVPVQTIANAYDTLRGDGGFAGFSQHPFAGETLFVRGALSSYVQASHTQQIAALFPHYRLHTIDAANHWLHIEKPKEFNSLVFDFLHRQTSGQL